MNNSAQLSNTERLILISELNTLLSSGIPIAEALNSMLESAKGNQKRVLEHLLKDINEGKKISESFASLPKAFDPVTINLIRASEEAGTLDTTLKDLTANIKKDIEFTDKVKSALTYPLFVFVVFAGTMLLILTFVMPRISNVFAKLKVNLPLPTKILIWASNTFLANTLPIIIGTIFFIVLAIILYKVKKSFFLNIFFSLPLLSTLAKQIDITRFTRSMSLLLSSGIPIIDALSLSKNVIYKKDVYKAIEKAKEVVSSGRKLSDAFKEFKTVIPSLMVRITEAGERSGTLEKSMQELSEFFDNEVSKTLKTVTTLLEPIMLVLMGLMVGGMMLAIIAPIYNLIGQIKGR